MYRLSTLAAEDFATIYEYTLLNFGVDQTGSQTQDNSYSGSIKYQYFLGR